MTNNKKGIILMLTAALFFALTSACVKLAVSVPTSEKIFVRNLISVVVAAFILHRRKQAFIGKDHKLLLLRSLLGLLGLVTYFYSLKFLSLGDAVSLNKLSPFFTMILAALFLKERIRPMQIPAILFALFGAILISKPQFGYTFFPAVIGIIGALFAGGAYTTVRALRKTDSPETIVFYFSAISTLSTLPFYKQFIIPPPHELTALIGIGIFAIIAQFAMTYSYRFSPAGDLSIYDYSQIIFSMIIGMGLGQGLPDIISLGGIGLILLGAWINFYVIHKPLTA